MNHNPDEYYNRSEVSNSDLTELKNILHPRMQFGDKEAAFRFGNLVDAIITEPVRVNYFRFTVDDIQYNEDEFRHAQEMHKALRMEARRDQFLARVLAEAETQCFMVNHDQQFEYGGYPFTLDTRCKWDWWLKVFHFGGDLKTTFAASQAEFDEAVDFFDWDRSRAWYMDIANPTVISSMQYQRKTARYSKNSSSEAMRYTLVAVRNTRSLPFSIGASIYISHARIET